MQVRNYIRLPALRYLGFCNLLYIYMGVSGPSLPIESTDSMIIYQPNIRDLRYQR